ncbi:MAG: ABC transporter permease subunit [Ardenticatenales bacterium]|nr:ABC transporter permease subunit [Ardenticatenales bacterium]
MTHPLRHERIRAAVAQLAVAALVLALVGWLAAGVLADMRARNLVPGLGFLRNVAGFGISEGPAFAPTDSYGRALVVGLANTLRVAVLGIVLATVWGFAVALARLSGNVLLGGMARGYIEALRNTPLVLQLVLWLSLLRALPPLSEAIALGPVGNAAGAAGGAATQTAWLLLSRKGAAIAWWQLTDGAPFLALDLPTTGRFGYDGGLVLSPEFAALLFGLVVYTGAFIAEVVRSGIEAVSHGQLEAARAVGLREGQALRLIVLPQAMRVIVPPLTNQYLNLAKNSSLAIFIGYPDLFNVSQTVGNQTGQFVAVLGIVMAVYLTISLGTSLAMNAYSRRARWVGR